MKRSLATADTRAAPAALARHSHPDIPVDRILLVDDTDEDATQILTVITERSCPIRNACLEVQS